MTACHVNRCLLCENTAELFILNGSFGTWVAMCNTILPQRGYQDLFHLFWEKAPVLNWGKNAAFGEFLDVLTAKIIFTIVRHFKPRVQSDEILV